MNIVHYLRRCQFTVPAQVALCYPWKNFEDEEKHIGETIQLSRDQGQEPAHPQLPSEDEVGNHLQGRRRTESGPESTTLYQPSPMKRYRGWAQGQSYKECLAICLRTPQLHAAASLGITRLLMVVQTSPQPRMSREEVQRWDLSCRTALFALI